MPRRHESRSSGIQRDAYGRITGFFVYGSDPQLQELTALDRLQWPELAAMADSIELSTAFLNHPGIGPLLPLVAAWRGRPLVASIVGNLPEEFPYLLGPLPTWKSFMEVLERVEVEGDLPPDEGGIVRKAILGIRGIITGQIARS